ncbi:transcription initiation protein spt4 [Lentinula guzmanii]|uniref:Transcription elongation factor SPT4 n=4 Tax=Lentinula TaxID=5352 RepID=A0AA38J5C8_9AGAR|nr:transcription initiation protein spt4 [Lentinula guzmanii]KAJ3746513.1 transcription initiation protein spt4 [Lentinula detonsa]KAJ3790059.1 transcription initiation protein spt4 [Lentinula aff. detonsa]KAJ3995338.1 transcription initiation protein spt4 [Lentinula boryana]KAJ3796018.1 transcription initiation protein spt4 [Lentinula aff. detonsa]
MSDAASAIIPPTKSRHLRACLLCSIIQTSADFRSIGCPNCEEILQLKDNPDRILACTTSYFDGVIALIDTETSWVARWQRTAKYARGMYAARVKGRVPEDVEAELDSRGIKYRPRDQSEQD